jgi:hypothetical protein
MSRGNLFDSNFGIWASDDMEAWVDERLAWAKEYPGVGYPDFNIVSKF